MSSTAAPPTSASSAMDSTLEAAIAFLDEYDFPYDAGDQIAWLDGFAGESESHLTSVNTNPIQEQPMTQCELFNSSSSDSQTINDLMGKFHTAQSSKQSAFDVELANDDDVTVKRDQTSSIERSKKNTLLKEQVITQPTVVDGVRLRKREELIYLRDQVQLLEGKLSELIDIQQQKSTSDSNKDSRSNTQAPSISLELWKDIAVRQLEHRKKVELENKRLRDLVGTQIRVAASLQRLMKKRTSTEAIEDVLGLRSRRRFYPVRKDVNFDELVGELDGLYTKVDTIFAGDQLDRSASRVRRQQVKQDPVQGVALEFIESQLVPFDMQVAERAIWLSVGERGITEVTVGDLYHKNIMSTEDTIMSSYNVVVRRRDVEANVQMRKVTRKYIEENRIVFVSICSCEPTLVGDGPSLGVSYRETRWLVLMRGDLHSSGPTTLIHSHTIVQQFKVKGQNGREVLLGDCESFPVTAWDESISHRNKVFEMVLLEEASK